MFVDLSEPPASLRGEERDWRLLLLRAYANGLAGFYGVPVYLVGSACAEVNTEPRDWDVRITLPDEDFAMRFGPVADWIGEGVDGRWTKVRYGWSAECVKHTERGWQLTGSNVDCQVYPESYANARFAQRARYRLDSLPLEGGEA